MPPTVVDLAVPPAAAYDRVLASLLAQGYLVAEGSRESGLVKTGAIAGGTTPVGGLSPLVTTFDYFIRATILPRDSGSRISLQATGRSRQNDVASAEWPVGQCPTVGPVHVLAECQAAETRVRGWLEAVAQSLRGR
jgi:hypothetical protein